MNFCKVLYFIFGVCLFFFQGQLTEARTLPSPFQPTLPLSSNLTQEQTLDFGGVSGGGGNVIHPTPPQSLTDHETVEHLVKESLIQLRSYLNSKAEQFAERQMSPADQELYARIFSEEKSIIKALNQVQPDLEDDRPCFDFDGKPVDASIASRHKNKFCFSSFAIRFKVTPTEIPAQSLALMLHEYSEIVGANEGEATALQVRALQDLSVLQ